jgi:hypothetical protein
MTPSEVKGYLADRRRATVGDIATHFGSSPDAVAQVLRLWLDKGRVKCLPGHACPAGCGCGTRPEDVYEWVQ